MKAHRRGSGDTTARWPVTPDSTGLHILARIIARCYLEGKPPPDLKKEKHSGPNVISDELGNQSRQKSNNEPTSSDDEYGPS
jgi:hypothetical protein